MNSKVAALACLLWAGPLWAGEPAPARPRLAVVIDDLGLTYPKDQPDEDWMSIPWPVTFAVMPVSPRTTKAARRVKESGHELIIHFPFDKYLQLELPKDRVSEGDLKKVRDLLDKAFAQIPGPRGLNNHQSYRATMNRPMMRAFMSLFKPRGIYFLDSHVSAKSVAYEEARRAGIPAAVNSIFLDGGHEPRGRRSRDPKVLAEAIAKDKAICERYLRLAAGLARKNGHAVAIGHHYYRGTYQCLREEVPKLQAEGFEFVFASQLAK
jgi:polysaccharide deacetylase 2 family uncharacterized protein YibQ